MIKRIKKLTALVLAAALAVLPANAAMADVVTAGDSGKVTVSNVLHIAEGTTVPTIEYTYTTTSVTVSQAEKTVTVPSDTASQSISYSSSDTIENDMVSKNFVLDLSTSNISYPSAGVYEFKVVETCDSSAVVASDDEKVNLDQMLDDKEYLISVYVKNSDDGLVIYGVTAQSYDSDTGELGEKVESLKFEETFIRVLSTLTSLSINKTIAGEYADMTKEFSYTVSFVNPSTVSEQTIAMTVHKADGSEKATGSVDLTDSEIGELTFTLGHGEYVLFTDVTAGTSYTVEETAADGYTASYTKVAGGTESDKVTGTKVDTTVISDAGENSVSYVNTYKDITVTGVIVNNAPFVAMIAFAALALIGLTVLAIRRRYR